ncbi:MAG: relaxase/mobilization nuclease domain-containing protein, partial [Prevotella sp.]|nr:relaxase/mobilization nuclease domain-containing protein [Prevotella sp.]
MIATILPSSTNFHAVEYNEMKVAKGKAELIEMANFGYIGMLGSYTPKDLTDYLISYSSSNTRIKNAQFHLAISCKGNEYSQEELVRIARQYLKEMGYGEPGQPILIYAHHDTDNNHIHVITSRVDPHGKKINHNHERLRSQEVINRIMGVNEQLRIGEAVSEALQYSFTSIPHFR